MYPEELRTEIDALNDILFNEINNGVYKAGFDCAYFNGFRVNKKMLKDYPNLWAYARDLYQQPGFGETTDFDAIKKHYHLCCLVTNPHQILPLGPEEELLEQLPKAKIIYGSGMDV